MVSKRRWFLDNFEDATNKIGLISQLNLCQKSFARPRHSSIYKKHLFPSFSYKKASVIANGKSVGSYKLQRLLGKSNRECKVSYKQGTT